MNMQGSFVRNKNRQLVEQDSKCQKAIQGLHRIEEFLNEFGFLSFGRDFVLCRRQVISLQIISTSCELTVGSIIHCCESACLADAYSLLRKYRDDLFFYLYIVVFDTCKRQNDKSPAVAQMESNIERWTNNGLDDLHIGTILQAIAQSSQAKDAVKRYNLKSYFDALGDRLNNYVHGNGVAYYNQNVNSFQEKPLHEQLQGFLKDMRFITITFLFLLTLCSPYSVMSTDYGDCLDCNTSPPDGSPYWVAPFIASFFKSNFELIDGSCMKYLQDNTLMEFEP